MLLTTGKFTKIFHCKMSHILENCCHDVMEKIVINCKLSYEQVDVVYLNKTGYY